MGNQGELFQMTEQRKTWAEFVRAEPIGFAYGETCCCAFAMRWAAKLSGGEVPGAAILNQVRHKTSLEAWPVLDAMGGMAKAVNDALCAHGWKKSAAPENYGIVVIDNAGKDCAGIFVDGAVVTKAAKTGGILILRNQTLKEHWTWQG